MENIYEQYSVKELEEKIEETKEHINRLESELDETYDSAVYTDIRAEFDQQITEFEHIQSALASKKENIEILKKDIEDKKKEIELLKEDIADADNETDHAELQTMLENDIKTLHEMETKLMSTNKKTTYVLIEYIHECKWAAQICVMKMTDTDYKQLKENIKKLKDKYNNVETYFGDDFPIIITANDLYHDVTIKELTESEYNTFEKFGYKHPGKGSFEEIFTIINDMVQTIDDDT